MYYGQSLLQPGEWIITKEVPKIVDGSVLSLIFIFCYLHSYVILREVQCYFVQIGFLSSLLCRL